jgi:SecD/SecF fusion protein
MAVYYLYAGMIADLAMVINLVLLLGAMSFIQAVFTLPGIAGTILSVTMAVDANVLIYERLREEQAKTQSMRMAIKNAYAGAFSAIFDSNLTTVLAALIMVWVGTEEVRGFGITLALGLSFSLFTSLTVTRWIYTLMLDRNVLRNKVPMLRLIGVPNINWMSKRRLFWIGSLLLATAGLVALFAQGKDIMGIEFSSGTQAVFSFNKGDLASLPDGKKVAPERPVVEKALDDAAAKLVGENRAKAAADPDQAGPLNQEADQLLKFKNSIRVETMLNMHKPQLPRDLGLNKDTIDRNEWKEKGLAEQIFDQLDKNKDDTLDQVELAGLPENSYQVSTTVVDADLVQKVIFAAFGKSLAMHSKVESVNFQDKGKVAGLGVALSGPYTEITREMAEKQIDLSLQPVAINYINGLLYVVDVKPGLGDAEMSNRIQTMRMQQDFAAYRNNRTQVMGLEGPAGNYTRLAVLVEKLPQQDINDLGRKTQGLISAALQRQESLESVQLFDPAMASESSQLAIIALVLSWLSIIAYLWLRFGSMQWGLAAVICLMHDVAIAIGMVAVSAFLAKTVLGPWLLITPIQIDMTIVAALLTIVGYSVNDTIVVFDRIRENRGKLKEVTPVLINHAINQTLSRTILTSTATIFALAVMYIWGGPAIHGFCYTLLIGFVIGTFSSIAVASPLLLGFKEAFIGRAFSELSGRRPQPVTQPLAPPPSQPQLPEGK